MIRPLKHTLPLVAACAAASLAACSRSADTTNDLPPAPYPSVAQPVEQTPTQKMADEVRGELKDIVAKTGTPNTADDYAKMVDGVGPDGKPNCSYTINGMNNVQGTCESLMKVDAATDRVEKCLEAATGVKTGWAVNWDYNNNGHPAWAEYTVNGKDSTTQIDYSIKPYDASTLDGRSLNITTRGDARVSGGPSESSVLQCLRGETALKDYGFGAPVTKLHLKLHL